MARKDETVFLNFRLFTSALYRLKNKDDHLSNAAQHAGVN